MRAAIYAPPQHVRSRARESAPGATALHLGTGLWTAIEFVDKGISGAKDRRPALDELIRDARRRKFDVLVCWRLDRLGRNLRHLILLLDELTALGVAFVSLGEGIDATTPAGRLQLHLLGAISEFERGRIRERVLAGLARARAQGKRLGRPRLRPATLVVPGGSVRAAAAIGGCPSVAPLGKWKPSARTGLGKNWNTGNRISPVMR